MNATRKTERKRGCIEAKTQLPLLQEKWPKAFPRKDGEVRPLACGVTSVVAEEFGWPRPYAKAILETWKLREAYCRAVLTYPVRIELDGTPTADTVSEAARAQAQKMLAKRLAKKQRLAEEQEKRKLQENTRPDNRG